MKRVLVCLASLLPLVATAQMEAYGFRFGSPIDLPACDAVTKHKIVMATCLRAPRLGELLKEIVFYEPELPAYLNLYDNVLPARVDQDGNLTLLMAGTRGLSVQTVLYNALRAKYGEPTKSRTDTMSNAMGATFPSINADWDVPGLSVRFVGVTSRHDRGSLIIGTPAAVAEYHAKLRQIGRPL